MPIYRRLPFIVADGQRSNRPVLESPYVELYPPTRKFDGSIQRGDAAAACTIVIVCTKTDFDLFVTISLFNLIEEIFVTDFVLFNLCVAIFVENDGDNSDNGHYTIDVDANKMFDDKGQSIE